MPKPFLIIQLRPEDEAADNELLAILHHGGLNNKEIVRIRAEQNGLPDINLDDYAAIIVGGSPFDISTPKDRKTAIQLKIEADFYTLFDDIVERDFPFLGCCSGNGLLGSYCGTTMSATYREPVGGVDITITEEGKRDPLLAGFPNVIRALVGHKEACDFVPAQCTLLATSQSCPVQMFRLKNNIYATQFHPEADAAGFEVRINLYKHHGYFAPETANALIQSIQREKTPYAQKVLKRFVNRFRV